MKRIFRTMATVLMAVAVSAAFFACGDPETPPAPPREYTAREVATRVLENTRDAETLRIRGNAQIYNPYYDQNLPAVITVEIENAAGGLAAKAEVKIDTTVGDIAVKDTRRYYYNDGVLYLPAVDDNGVVIEDAFVPSSLPLAYDDLLDLIEDALEQQDDTEILHPQDGAYILQGGGDAAAAIGGAIDAFLQIEDVQIADFLCALAPADYTRAQLLSDVDAIFDSERVINLVQNLNKTFEHIGLPITAETVVNAACAAADISTQDLYAMLREQNSLFPMPLPSERPYTYLMRVGGALVKVDTLLGKLTEKSRDTLKAEAHEFLSDDENTVGTVFDLLCARLDTKLKPYLQLLGIEAPDAPVLSAAVLQNLTVSSFKTAFGLRVDAAAFRIKELSFTLDAKWQSGTQSGKAYCDFVGSVEYNVAVSTQKP